MRGRGVPSWDPLTLALASGTGLAPAWGTDKPNGLLQGGEASLRCCPSSVLGYRWISPPAMMLMIWPSLHPHPPGSTRKPVIPALGEGGQWSTDGFQQRLTGQNPCAPACQVTHCTGPSSSPQFPPIHSRPRPSSCSGLCPSLAALCPPCQEPLPPTCSIPLTRRGCWEPVSHDSPSARETGRGIGWGLGALKGYPQVTALLLTDLPTNLCGCHGDSIPSWLP